LTIFFIFLTPPFFTGGDDDDAPFMGCRLVDVLAAAAPPRVDNLSLLLLCTDDDDEVEPVDDKFQGSRRDDPKMPRPLDDDDDCTALTPLSVIEMTATRQTPSAVAVYCRPILMMHVLCEIHVRLSSEIQTPFKIGFGRKVKFVGTRNLMVYVGYIMV